MSTWLFVCALVIRFGVIASSLAEEDDAAAVLLMQNSLNVVRQKNHAEVEVEVNGVRGDDDQEPDSAPPHINLQAYMFMSARNNETLEMEGTNLGGDFDAIAERGSPDCGSRDESLNYHACVMMTSKEVGLNCMRTSNKPRIILLS